jgi:6-phosphogluconolactonase
MAKVVEILPNLDAIAQRASEILETQLQAAIAERGQFTIALAGGSTP